MPLPVKQAAKLADTMAKSGLSGSIMMGKKAPAYGAEPPEDDGADGEAPEQEGSEMDSCIDDVAEAMMSGDKDSLKSALHALVECIQHEDEEEDQQE